MTAFELIRAGEVVGCYPWPRYVLSQAAWFEMARALRREPWLRFLALWADGTAVHALFEGDAPVVVSVVVEAGLYAALSPGRPGAALFERAVADLWGHQAADAVDVRPWLDHGVWPMLRPLSDRPVPNTAADGAEPEVPEMMEVAGDAVGVGPLPPTFSGPAVWRVTVGDGVVRRLEGRFGWGHRGVLGLMRGKSAGAAARLVGRIDGGATVAHATAFARAVEAAAGLEAPAAAQGARILMLALERLAVGLEGVRREAVLRACKAVFGHRLMMDVVRPGGVGCDLAVEGLMALDEMLAGLGGGEAVEAARVAVANVPAGVVAVVLPHREAEGLGVAEGPAGAVWHWVRMGGGVVVASFAAGPEWLMVPALERGAVGLGFDGVGGVAGGVAEHLAGLRVGGIDL